MLKFAALGMERLAQFLLFINRGVLLYMASLWFVVLASLWQPWTAAIVSGHCYWPFCLEALDHQNGNPPKQPFGKPVQVL